LLSLLPIGEQEMKIVITLIIAFSLCSSLYAVGEVREERAMQLRAYEVAICSYQANALIYSQSTYDIDFIAFNDTNYDIQLSTWNSLTNMSSTSTVIINHIKNNVYRSGDVAQFDSLMNGKLKNNSYLIFSAYDTPYGILADGISTVNLTIYRSRRKRE